MGPHCVTSAAAVSIGLHSITVDHDQYQHTGAHAVVNTGWMRVFRGIVQCCLALIAYNDAHVMTVAMLCLSQLSAKWHRTLALLEEGADELKSGMLHVKRSVAW